MIRDLPSDVPAPLETLEIEPARPATASVIWLHGLGADASDFYSVPPQLGLPADLAVRWVFPNAPTMPVTINMGAIMRAWYDVRGFDRLDQDEVGIRRSAEGIGALVEREQARGIPNRRVVLAGFSQGGAMSLFVGLRRRERLAGIMCLSGYLVLDATLAVEAGAESRETPIFQAHGTNDPMVSRALGRGSFDLLSAGGFSAEWHEYPMGHSVCLEELQDIGSWLGQILGASPAPA